MPGGRTSSRHIDRPSSGRRHHHDSDTVDGQPAARSSTHRHRSSSRHSPHRQQRSPPRESHRFRPEDYTLEGGVPPLRRESTQPPRRRTSPTSFPAAGATAFHRREVEPTSARRQSAPHTHRSSRHSTPVEPALSTALVVGEREVSPRRRSSRNSARRPERDSSRTSPRRNHRDSPIEREDGVVRSPRQHKSSGRTSPSRPHRQTGSPIRPERRRVEGSARRHRLSSVEPRTHSTHSSVRRHREAPAAAAASAPVQEATSRQDTLRYRSPPLVDKSKRTVVSPRRSRRESNGTAAAHEKRQEKEETRVSPRRSRSTRSPSHHETSKRPHHAHRASTLTSSDRSRNTPHPRPPSVDSYVVPALQHLPTFGDTTKASAPLAGGSTYMRATPNARHDANRRSGSCIEVISVSSARPGSSHSWLQSRTSAPQSPRPPRDVAPAALPVDPCSQKIMQRIDSTRHWIQNMKAEVQKEREREEEAAKAAEEEEKAQQRDRERESARAQRHRSAERKKNGSADRHRSSSAGSRRHSHDARKEANGTSTKPFTPSPLVDADKIVSSRRHAREPIAPAAPAEKRRHSTVEATEEKRRRHSSRTSSARPPSAHSGRENGSRRSAKPVEPAPVAPPPPPAPAQAMHDTFESSRHGSFDYPIFSFVSFLDGNTFDSTAGLCQYNTQLAESLSDEHLDLLRELVFDHDENAFAELLYGDDVQAEIDVIASTLGHSEDPAVLREIEILQRAAVRRFNEKCSTALRTLLAARGGLADAVQVAASQLEREAYEAGRAGTTSP